MNMFKKNGGFTLVELIVVIAILAILAGVALPVYSGYISKAQEAADTQVLSAVNTAIQAATAIEDDTFTVALDTDKSVEVTFTKTNVQNDYNTFIAGNDCVLEYYTTVTVENGLVVGSK